MADNDDDDDDTYLLLLLSDANLPTGSFVASAGLESFFAHGFSSSPSPSASRSVLALSQTTLAYTRSSLQTYARSAVGFVRDAHEVVRRFRAGAGKGGGEEALGLLAELDALYDCMNLNHVSRRASAAQGIALLTLYSRGFTRPAGLGAGDGAMADFIVELKLRVRRGVVAGHLPVCWGVLTAALGLPAERAVHLHLFLHARSLLSASVRLNTLGPYASQQLLLHAVRPLIDAEVARSAGLRTGVLDGEGLEGLEEGEGEGEGREGPAGTWPLGEILGARHDLLHSRIFNS